MKLTRRTTLATLGAGTGHALCAAPPGPQAKTVNVYNWADYIGETTLADFEAETGIGVVYDLYSSAEEMQAKMLAGSTGYDVVFMAGRDACRSSSRPGSTKSSTARSSPAGATSTPRS